MATISISRMEGGWVAFRYNTRGKRIDGLSYYKEEGMFNFGSGPGWSIDPQTGNGLYTVRYEGEVLAGADEPASINLLLEFRGPGGPDEYDPRLVERLNLAQWFTHRPGVSVAPEEPKGPEWMIRGILVRLTYPFMPPSKELEWLEAELRTAVRIVAEAIDIAYHELVSEHHLAGKH